MTIFEDKLQHPEEDRQRISWRITKIIDLTPK